MYDTNQTEDVGKPASDSALPELIVENFDDEQIWQQIELLNNDVVTDLLTHVSSVVSAKDKLKLRTKKADSGNANYKRRVKFQQKNAVNDDSSEDADDTDIEVEKIKSRLGEENPDSDGEGRTVFKGNNVLDIESDDDSDTDFKFPNLNPLPEEEEESETDEENMIQREIQKSSGKGSTKKKKKAAASVVDDQFFKLADMEAFLEQEDAREERRRRGEESEDSEEEDIDMFADIPSDEEVFVFNYFTVMTIFRVSVI